MITEKNKASKRKMSCMPSKIILTKTVTCSRKDTRFSAEWYRSPSCIGKAVNGSSKTVPEGRALVQPSLHHGDHLSKIHGNFCVNDAKRNKCQTVSHNHPFQSLMTKLCPKSHRNCTANRDSIPSSWLLIFRRYIVGKCQSLLEVKWSFPVSAALFKME